MTLTHSPAAPDAATLFSVRLEVGAQRLRVAGDLDLTTAPALLDAARVLHDLAAGPITIDLDDVTFCDAAGLNALVVLAAEHRGRGGRLHVENVSPRLRRTFCAGRASWLLQPAVPRRPRTDSRVVGCPRCGWSARIAREGADRHLKYRCRCHFKPGTEDLVRLWLGAGN